MIVPALRLRVRAACAIRLAKEEGAAALPEILPLLSEDDWRVRSAAAAALIGVGGEVVPAVRPLLHAEDQRVRVAAARVLSTLAGDEEPGP